jgi:KDO2-lipid IV(A) lauroyltransferase
VGRKKLALKHWKLLCRSFVERGYFWLGNKDKIKQLVQIESEVDLTDKKPRLYVGMHMVGIEAGLIGLSLHLQELGVIQPITLYIQMKNHFFDTRIKFWRERFGSQMMLRQENIRNFIRAIKNGQFLLLSPDMDLGLKDSIFVPFFKIPTCTVTSISRLAFLSQAEVCAVVTTLNPDGKSYTCKISRPWESFPSKDEVVDTLKLNQFFESQIQPRPAEYYWVHKRFKNRPDGQPRFY